MNFVDQDLLLSELIAEARRSRSIPTARALAERHGLTIAIAAGLLGIVIETVCGG